jgi:ankyrin repeat protein
MKVDLSISEDGFFLDGDRLNLLEWNFDEIRFKHNIFIVDSEINPDSNCCICYKYKYKEMAFLGEIYVWFTPDASPLSENDYKWLEEYYNEFDSSFMRRHNRWKLCGNIDSGILNKVSPDKPFIVPTGFEHTDYTCVLHHDKKLGLNCFHLKINPVYEKGYKETTENKMRTELYHAIIANDINKVQKLIQNGVDIKYIERWQRKTFLDVAIANNSPDICELLIQNGLDVNYINGYGPKYSSIFLAADAGALDAGKVLLSHGANYNLFELIDYGPDCFYHLDFLLKCGANPDRGIKDGIFSPLMWAIRCDNNPAAQTLIKYGADVNVVGKHHCTALLVAVVRNNKEMAGLLLEHGANVNSKIDGKTNLEVALSLKNPDKEMIHLLSLCGGKISLKLNTLVYCHKSNSLFFLKKLLIPVIFSEDIQFIFLLLQMVK